MTQNNFNLKIISQKSVLDGLTLYEPVDIAILDKLISSDLLLETFHNPQAQVFNTNEKEQLLKYRKLIKDNRAAVTYKKSKIKYGRVNPNKSLGLFSLRRQIRHTLAKNNFVDIDIENAHPSILYQICKLNNIDCEHLEKYVLNRNYYLTKVMNKYKVSREEAKKLFLILLYLGSYGKWVIENKSKIKYDDITNLELQLKTIASKIILHNPDLCKVVKDVKDEEKESSIISYYLQEIENRILEEVYLYCKNQNYINNEECVLCADGLMISKELYEPQLLNELSELIKYKFNLTLKFTQKEMNEDYLDILDDHQIINIDGNSYEEIKYKFEKNNFKLINPISFVTIDKNKELIVRKKADFLTVYENLQYEKKEYNNKTGETIIKKCPFVSEWLKDEKINTYDTIDFLPKKEAPQNVYNTFTAFEAEKLESNNLNFNDSLMNKHIKNLCGNNEECYNYFLKFLAQKVQKPTETTRTAIVLQSIDGCGKDTFLNWFGNSILGKKFYVNTESIDLIFGRFNGIIQDKVLIVINETSGKDTFNLSDKIKASITNEKNTIEKKGYEPFINTNCISFIFLSNNKNPVKINENDRRFMVFECNHKIANNHNYFLELNKEIESKVYDKSFYDLLMNIDINNYDFTNNRPKTEAYNNVKEATRSPIITFYEDLIFKNSKEFIIESSSLYLKFTNYLKSNNFNYEYNNNKFGLELKIYENFIIKKRTKKGIYYTIKINELKEHLINTKQIEPINNEFIEEEEEEENEKSALDI